MKKTVIRHGVFETNSSSSHSISLNFDTVDEKVINYVETLLDNEGKLHVECGEFNWEQETHRDFNTKLSYIVTGLMNKTEDVYDPYGYIDHQSYSIFNDAFDSLEHYLFNPASILETDNDNH